VETDASPAGVPEIQVYGGDVSAQIFEHGLCLPSGSSLTEEDRQRVVAGVRSVFGR
jgi:dTDP-4-amino-4,6-dideoxygalactose transaminase